MRDSDEKIDLELLRARDPKLLKKLIHDATPGIRRAIRGFADSTADLEDLLQECWMRILEQLDHYKEDKSFRKWTETVSRNHCKALYRRERRACDAVTTEDVDVDDFEHRGPGPEEDFRRNQIRKALEQELACLPERECDAFVMKLVEGRPTSEIAEELAITPASVRRAVHRATGKLQKSEILQRLFLDE